MPSSPRPSSSDAPSGALGSDERGVSEILGYILTFGILSMVLVIAMLAFTSARDQAEDRVVEIQASSIAHRVSAAIVEVRAFVDAHPGTTEVQLRLDLPEAVESRGFVIDLCNLQSNGSCTALACSSGATGNAVRVTSESVVVFEPLLGVTALQSCVPSGPVKVVYSSSAAPPNLSLVEA